MSFTFLHIRILMGLVPALGAVLWLGMGSGGVYYEKSPSEVHSALTAAHLPTHILGSSVTGSRVRKLDAQTTITALIGKNGEEIMHFVTVAEPDGTGAHVSTTIQPPAGANASKVAERMKKDAFTAGLLEKLAQEHVAAALEGRPFNMMFASGPVAAGMVGAVPGMQQQIDDANASASAFAKSEQEWTSDGDSQGSEGSGEGDWGSGASDSSDGWND